MKCLPGFRITVSPCRKAQALTCITSNRVKGQRTLANCEGPLAHSTRHSTISRENGALCLPECVYMMRDGNDTTSSGCGHDRPDTQQSRYPAANQKPSRYSSRTPAVILTGGKNPPAKPNANRREGRNHPPTTNHHAECSRGIGKHHPPPEARTFRPTPTRHPEPGRRA